MTVLLLALTATLVAGAPDQQVKVGVQIPPEAQLLVLVFEQDVSRPDGLPMVKVRLGKVQMHHGAFQEELPLTMRERDALDTLLDQQFRLYRGPSQLGIFKYQEVPEERRPTKSGLYLEALPVDKDATVQALTKETRDQADLLNLLNMSTQDATTIAEHESHLNAALKAAQDAETALLRSGKLEHAKLFFVPVKVRR